MEFLSSSPRNPAAIRASSKPPTYVLLVSRRFLSLISLQQYSSDGALFLSAGSDGQVLLYDGTTGEDKGALLDGLDAAHKAGVFAGSFSRDSKSIATSSADAKVKLWDVETGKMVQSVPQLQFERDDMLNMLVTGPGTLHTRVMRCSISRLETSGLDPRSFLCGSSPLALS
jgi:WD40 repeat protein